MSDIKEISKIADEAAAKLMEHCDSVRIFVTVQDGGKEKTKSYDTGMGNFYAQLGQVIEWVELQHQYQRNYAIREERDEN